MVKNVVLFCVYIIKEEHICPDIRDNEYDSKDNYNFIINNYENKIDNDKFFSKYEPRNESCYTRIYFEIIHRINRALSPPIYPSEIMIIF